MGVWLNALGHKLLDLQITVLLDQLKGYLSNPHLRAMIVVDEPGADLDTAAELAGEHLEEARRLLAPFLVLEYAVGDLVDVVDMDEEPAWTSWSHPAPGSSRPGGTDTTRPQ